MQNQRLRKLPRSRGDGTRRGVRIVVDDLGTPDLVHAHDNGAGAGCEACTKTMTSRKTHDQGEQHGGAAATALMQNLAEQVGELGNERCDFGIGHNGCLQADRHGCEEWTGHEQDETTPPPVKHSARDS